MSPATLERKLKDKGIVNIFSCTKSVPVTEQIKDFIRKKNKTIVVRLFDEDTQRLTDSLMTKFYFDQITEGAKILAKITEADGILFVMNSKEIKDRKHHCYHQNTAVIHVFTVPFQKVMPYYSECICISQAFFTRKVS